jgi:bifunctional DNA-binding transcriptional regulator/antitoxin component of YhaV-PrlF toxin-antitoxin module
MQSWTITLEEDPETGDLVLPFTDEILQTVGWKEGDVVEWIDNKDGTWSLKKQDILTDDTK